MGAAARGRADVVVVTDDNPRSEDPAEIRAAVLAGATGRPRAASGAGATATVIDAGSARSEADRRGHRPAPSLAAAQPGGAAVDTVVVLGKGHEKGQEIHGVKHPFDDRDAVRAALAAVGYATEAIGDPA